MRNKKLKEIFNVNNYNLLHLLRSMTIEWEVMTNCISLQMSIIKLNETFFFISNAHEKET